MKFKGLFLFIMILCITISAISAADNDTFISIQNEIDNTDNGDAIFINETYCTPNSDIKSVNIENKDYTIDESSNGMSTSNLNGENLDQIFSIINSSVKFCNVDFINEYSLSSTLIIDDNIFSSNSNELNIENSQFEDTSAPNCGFSTYNDDNLYVTNVKFVDSTNNLTTFYTLNNRIFINSNIYDINSTPFYNNEADVILNNSTNNDINEVPKIYVNLYDANTNNIESSTSINVEPRINSSTIPTIITIKMNDGEYGQIIDGIITLKDLNGTYIPGTYEVKVCIKHWELMVPITNGIGIFSTPEPLNTGDYKANVTFNGDSLYEASFNDTTFTISKVTPPMYIDANIINKILEIQVTLPNNVFTHITINVADNHYNVEVFEGIGKLVLTNIPTGKFNITAFFAENENYLSVNKTVTLENGDIKPDHNETNNNTNNNTKNQLTTNQSELETGNPIALLLLTLFILPLRRFIKE